MEILIPALFILLMFAIVCVVGGHFTWVAIAWIFGKISGAALSESRPWMCPKCYAAREHEAATCRSCGHVFKMNPVDAINIASRVVEVHHNRGDISTGAHQQLQDAFDAERERLLNPHLPQQAEVPQQPFAPDMRQPPAPSAYQLPAATPPAASEDWTEETPAASTSATKPSETPPPELPPLEAEMVDVHPLDAPEPEPWQQPALPPKTPLQPRKKLADLLQSFMEDKNIRWGEIVSGLLIVGCATGLVISLRATLSAIPYFEALLFMLGTAAIHGAGIYTLRKWDLQSTSRAVLIIGMLLTPLNFLAAIILSGSGDMVRPLTDPYYLLAVTVALVAFSTMTYFASTALIRSGWQRLMLAVLGPSLAMLLINRLASTEMNLWRALLLAAAPVACFTVAGVWQLIRARQWQQFSAQRVGELYRVLGLGGFALLAALALIVAKDGSIGPALAKLAPGAALAAATICAAGMMIHRRTTARQLAGTRTAGTAIALCGAALLLMGTAVAWPQADVLIAVCAVASALLLALAVAVDLPRLHGLGIAFAAFALMLLFHVLQPHYYNPVEAWEPEGRRIVFSLLMGRSSLLLIALAALTAGAGLLVRRIQPASFLHYVGAAGVMALLAGAVAGYAGFAPGAKDADLATITFVLAGAGSLAAAFFLRRKEITFAATAMLYLAMIHAADWNVTTGGWLEATGIDPQRPVVVASLSHAIVMTLLAAAAMWRSDEDRTAAGSSFRELIAPLHIAAMVSSAATLPWTLYVQYGYFDNHAAYVGCIAAVWLAAAFALHRAEIFAGFQALATTAAAFMLLAVGSRIGWWNGALIDMSFTSVQIAAAAIWCLMWTVGRRMAPHDSLSKRLLAPGWPAIDQLLLGAVTLALLVNAFASAWPGVYLELTGETVRGWGGLAALPYGAVYGPAGWIALLCVLTALAAALWNRLSAPTLLAFMLAGLAGPLMLAGWAEGVQASASMLRWSLGGYCLLLITAVCARGYLLRGAAALLPGSVSGFGPLQRRHTTSTFIAGALICCGVPVLAITLTASIRAMNGLAPGGPAEDSLFHTIGNAGNYAAPLLMMVTALCALAFRQRQPAYALGGSAVLHLVVTLGYALAMLDVKIESGVYFIQMMQWHALTLGIFSLFWLAFAWRMQPLAARDASPAKPGKLWADWPLRVQLTLGAATILLIGFIARGLTTLIYFDAKSPFYSVQFDPMMRACGEWPSFVALGLMTAAFLIWGRKQMQRWYPHTAGASLICLVALLAAVAALYDRAGMFLPFKVLTLGLLLVSFAMLLAGIFLRRQGSGFAISAAGRCRWWALAVAGAPAFGALFSSPLIASRPSLQWWSVLLGVGLTILAATPGIARRGRLAPYVSTFAACFTAASFFTAVTTGTVQPLPSMPLFIATVACMAALFWLVVQFRREQQDRTAGRDIASRFTVSQVAATTASMMGLFTVCSCLLLGTLARLMGVNDGADVSTIWGMLFAASLVTLLAVSQWDRLMKMGLPCIYACGGMLLLMGLDQWEDTPLLAVLTTTPETPPRFTILMLGVIGGVYILLTAYLWNWGSRLSQTASILGIDDPTAGLRRAGKWLPVVTLLLAVFVILIEFVVVLNFPQRWMRIVAGFAPLLAAAGIALLAQQPRRRVFQVLSLVALSCGAVLLGWADNTVRWDVLWTLSILIRLLVVLGGMAGIYALLAQRILPERFDWNRPLRWMSLSVAAAGAVALVFVLLVEAASFGKLKDFAGAPVNTGQMTAVCAVLAAMVVTLLSLAVRKTVEELRTTNAGFRTALVYASQAIIVLLCVHFYLARPQWFGGFFRSIWPFVVLSVGLIYAMLSELTRRVKLEKFDTGVLTQPLLNISLALPLLPVLALFVPAEFVYSYDSIGVSRPVVMVLAGVLYMFVSMVRKTPVAMVAGVACGNLALWTLWLDTGLNIQSNPQFWLIPPALSALIAVQWNRQRLSETVVTSLRYSCVAIIYLSSTAEMMISSAEHHLWPPMVLMALAVAGVFVGIVMRIRAFLFVSAFFVLLSIVSMVWHAARAIEHVWPWWAFGMGLGISIMVLFGLFELKRDEINGLIKRLKNWEA